MANKKISQLPVITAPLKESDIFEVSVDNGGGASYTSYSASAKDIKAWTASVRTQSITSAATVTPVSSDDIVVVTAQATALSLANPTGIFEQGQALMIRIKDNGAARAITYDTNYRAIGVTLPTTTVVNKTTYIGIIYNSTDGKWDIIGVTTQI